MGQPRVVGLTSAGNVEFTRGLGCYDDVLTYQEVSKLDSGQTTVYLDLSGRPEVRDALRNHLGDSLVRDLAVGFTSQIPNAASASAVFFAPDQMRKRSIDWGREGLDARFSQAWHQFSAVVENWVEVSVGHGPQALREAWLEVLGGHTPARKGHVISFRTD
jgi:hypothetical protein